LWYKYQRVKMAIKTLIAYTLISTHLHTHSWLS
jgi:hypothetical protein